MADPRVTTMARILVEHSTRIGEGDLVLINSSVLAEPLVSELYRMALLRGAHPHIRIRLPGLEETFYRHATDAQLDFLSPLDCYVYEQFDVVISILSDANTRALSNVDPVKQVRVQKAHRPLMETFMKRGASGDLRWCATLFPTHAYAQDAEMSLSEYEDFVFNAAMVHEPDPMAAWQALSRRQQELVDWLKGRKRVHIVGPDTDLTLGIEGRTFINSDGHENFPDGEIFTGPEESVTEGCVRFTYPAVDSGREVEDVRLWFEGGKVVKASAAKNEAFLLSMLDTDAGARRLGEFAIGLNPDITRFTKNVLFDEKISDTIHMAVGAAYPETGGVNRSAIHWDMVCDLRQGGQVWVDGEPFYVDGTLKI